MDRQAREFFFPRALGGKGDHKAEVTGAALR